MNLLEEAHLNLINGKKLLLGKKKILINTSLMTKMLIEINIYGNDKTDFQTKVEIFTGIVCSGIFGELLKVRLQTNQMGLKLLKINC